ncbi:CDP-alcohol phosphatidyltransferase family protein [Halosolutus gelatinilyticus]|uniref:CDP-alcohol phosphatidyltransferase family protein n=1 Tax=Halosolutus gelatinilyticus TaxID=2931975 RepID=UPI001FF54A48|nr:CDP-alcohol phosphatidyltransferase family protein [Halosolutus gelatinilyticus]
MSDRDPPIGLGNLREWRTRATIDRTQLSDGDFLRALSIADYCSLTSLLFAWTAALLIVSGELNWGIVAMFAAFGFDKLDGYVARRGYGSEYGLQIDSFIDVFAYLVTAALIYHVALAPTFVASLVVGFAIAGFGGLRLVRHAHEGFSSDDQGSFYRGITVVHVNVVVVGAYILAQFVDAWNGWITAALVLAVAPLMISNYRCYKTNVGHVLVAAGGIAASVVAVALELGYL